jgi:hypothetical protein
LPPLAIFLNPLPSQNSGVPGWFRGEFNRAGWDDAYLACASRRIEMRLPRIIRACVDCRKQRCGILPSSRESKMKDPAESNLIFCCSPFFGKDWRWFGPELTADGTDWVFLDDRSVYFWESTIRKPNLAMMRMCLQAVVKAKRRKAGLLITHGERVSLWCGLFCRLIRVRIPLVCYSFNFADLPTGIRRRMMTYAFRQLDELTVHSSIERDLYSEYFGIPKDRIRLRLWSVAKARIVPEHPLFEGAYVSSIGGNGRDYRTLIEASLLTPDIPIVLVARPENLAGIAIPPHVKVLLDYPFEKTMNILRHSAFTVVPLAGTAVPCGHVTLVQAMHFERAIVATDSAGIAEYVIQGYNGMRCTPFSPASLSEAISRLWRDPKEAARLGENGRRFASEHCSETTARADLSATLRRWNVPLRQPVPPGEASASA